MNSALHKSFQTKTKKILRECKAFVDGSHFVYASGNHGDFYVNKDALYMHPMKLDDVSCMMYEVCSAAYGKNVDVILAPTYGGVILGQQLAYNYSLDTNKDVLFAYSELDVSGTYRVLRRGFSSLMKNARVIVVDDIVTTGNTLMALAQAAMGAGAHVLGASVLVDRGKIRNLKFYPMDKKGVMDTTPFDLRIVPLLEMDLKTFPRESCPLCAAGRPIDPEFGEGHLQDPFKSICVNDVAAIKPIRIVDEKK